MTTREALTRAQIALHQQDPVANEEIIAFLDRLGAALGYVEDAKLYVDRIAAVVAPSEGERP
jgi:hypothetical protein